MSRFWGEQIVSMVILCGAWFVQTPHQTHICTNAVYMLFVSSWACLPTLDLLLTRSPQQRSPRQQLSQDIAADAPIHRSLQGWPLQTGHVAGRSAALRSGDHGQVSLQRCDVGPLRCGWAWLAPWPDENGDALHKIKFLAMN